MTQDIPAFYSVHDPLGGAWCSGCSRETELWHICKAEFVVCARCQIFRELGYGLNSSWQLETPEIWHQRERRLATFAEAECYVPASQDTPPHIRALLDNLEWNELLEDFASGRIDARLNYRPQEPDNETPY